MRSCNASLLRGKHHTKSWVVILAKYKKDRSYSGHHRFLFIVLLRIPCLVRKQTCQRIFIAVNSKLCLTELLCVLLLSLF